MPWPLRPSITKYPTSNDDWTTTETQFLSQRVIALRGMSSMMRPEHRPSLYPREMESINKHTGSSSWPKGKWQGSPGSTFQGKPHLSQKCTLPPLRGRKMSWGLSMPCQGGFGCYSQGPLPTMAHCSSMSRLLTIGEWSERSSNSDSSSIICQTSTSKSPITRLSLEECHKPRPWPRGDWSSPTLTTTRRTYTSSVLNLEEQHDPTNTAPDSGGGWTPSR
jgi:hypothetical protein